MLLPSSEYEFCRVAREFHIELLTHEANLSILMEIPLKLIHRTTVSQYLVNPGELSGLESALEKIKTTVNQLYADTRSSFMRFRDISDLSINSEAIWDLFFNDVALMVLDYIDIIREQLESLTIPQFLTPPDAPTGQQVETLTETKIDVERCLSKIECFLKEHYFVAYAT